MIYTEEININVYSDNEITIHAVQGEGGARKIIFNLIETSGEQIPTSNVPVENKMLDVSDSIINLFVLKPDGKIVYQNGTIENGQNGKISFILNSENFTQPGKAVCFIQIISAKAELRVVGITLKILSASTSDEQIESTNEFSALAQALQKVVTLSDAGAYINDGTINYNMLSEELKAKFGELIDTEIDTKMGEIKSMINPSASIVYFKDGSYDIVTGNDFSENKYRDNKNVQLAFLGTGVITIGKDAFRGCTQLQIVKMRNSVTDISEGAFYGCTFLHNVKLSDRINYIGINAFTDTAIDFIKLPNSLEIIDKFAFSNCRYLRNIELPPFLKEIRDNAFNSCVQLSKITIPTSVTALKARIFAYCNSLTDVTIPVTTTQISDTAFEQCLQTVIHGEYGSCAETFATNNGLEFTATNSSTIDNTVKMGSNNAVTSGAVYDIIGDVDTILDQILAVQGGETQ